MEALGLGNQALRRIPTDSALRMDVDALRAAGAPRRVGSLFTSLGEWRRLHQPQVQRS
jgi:glutamate/tyrosine decarboxylase-like PLP-dependent enzyme